MKERIRFVIIVVLMVLLFGVTYVFMNNLNSSYIKNKFKSYEYNEAGFNSNTNKALKIVFEKDVYTKDDVITLSYSFIDGYKYLLSLNKKEILLSDLSNEELGSFIISLLYNEEGRYCSDIEFIEELVFNLTDQLTFSLEDDQKHFNPYSNSYCGKKKTYNKYDINYNYIEETGEYLVANYSLNNYQYENMNVYFKEDDGRYLLHKIVVE